ncbi:MAG: type II secretion system F family protein [Pseudomonas sp.]
MSLALLLLSVALLCLAGGIELWWNVTARQRQRTAANHVATRLGTTAPAASPSANAPRARATVPQQALPAWRALLRRADLRDHPSTLVLLALPGIVLTTGTWLRMHSLIFAVLALVLYVFAAALWLRRRIEHQRQQLLRQLPDFLENMVRLAGIGNSLSIAFQTSTAQVVPPLRPLLDTALVYTRGGMDLDRALQQAARPYRLQALETLSVILGTSLRIGGRSDQILQRMSDFLRDLEQVQQELTATTSETRMSAWVIGLLPPAMALLMALFSPDFFRPMLEQAFGHKLMIAALLLEGLGALLLYRLAKSL